MITVRPVIVDASICYMAPLPPRIKTKAAYEVVYVEAGHGGTWRFMRSGVQEEMAARMADPDLKVEIGIACDVLFSREIHPKHGHFDWAKLDVQKRLYINAETRDSYYMQGQTYTFITGTRLRPKRVTRKKIRYYMHPETGEIYHTIPRWVSNPPDKDGNPQGMREIQHDQQGKEVPAKVGKETVNWLYDLKWKADGITNLNLVLDMLAEDTA